MGDLVYDVGQGLSLLGLAPGAGLEPATLKLTASCSTIELPGIVSMMLLLFGGGVKELLCGGVRAGAIVFERSDIMKMLLSGGLLCVELWDMWGGGGWRRMCW